MLDVKRYLTERLFLGRSNMINLFCAAIRVEYYTC